MLRDQLKYQGTIYLSADDLQDALKKMERLNHGLKQAESPTKKEEAWTGTLSGMQPYINIFNTDLPLFQRRYIQLYVSLANFIVKNIVLYEQVKSTMIIQYTVSNSYYRIYLPFSVKTSSFYSYFPVFELIKQSYWRSYWMKLVFLINE